MRVETLLLILWSPLLWAASNMPTPKVQPPNLVHIGRGKIISTQIDVAVDKPFHVQANPASKAGLVPTEIIVDALAGLSVKKIKYPQGIPFKLAQGTEPISVYEGEFGIGLDLRAERNAPKGKQTLHAHLKYQACDEKTCFRPSELPFEVSVEIQ